MNNFSEKLKEYFENTSQGKILEDWAKSKEYDNIGPTIAEFLISSQQFYPYTNDLNNWCMEYTNNQISPKFSSGFLFNNNLNQYAKSRLLNN